MPESLRPVERRFGLDVHDATRSAIAFALLRRLADRDPVEDSLCRYCFVVFWPGHARHLATCLWLQAKELVGDGGVLAVDA